MKTGNPRARFDRHPICIAIGGVAMAILLAAPANAQRPIFNPEAEEAALERLEQSLSQMGASLKTDSYKLNAQKNKLLDEISDFGAEDQEIAELKKSIEQGSREYHKRPDERLRAEVNQRIDEYNTRLRGLKSWKSRLQQSADQYKHALADFDARQEKYNSSVDRYNTRKQALQLSQRAPRTSPSATPTSKATPVRKPEPPATIIYDENAKR